MKFTIMAVGIPSVFCLVPAVFSVEAAAERPDDDGAGEIINLI